MYTQLYVAHWSLLVFLDDQDVSAELYGPLMVTLTLVAILLYGMKSTGHHMVGKGWDLEVAIKILDLHVLHVYMYVLVLYMYIICICM